MITAAGAGASFCTVTPARLRPKTPKSPRGSQPQQPSPIPVQTQPQAQEIIVPAPPPFLHNYLLNRTNTAITSSAFGSSSVLDPDDWDLTGESTADDSNPILRGPQSPISSEFLEPPSPKSFYSAATSSSGGTARGVSATSLEDFAHLLPMDHVLQPQQGRKLEKIWPNSSEAAQTLFGTSPETSGFYGADLDQSPRSNSRKKSSSRDPSVPSTNHGREICIAVVGKPEVGKSTFIQKAYDLKSLPKPNCMSSKSMKIDKLMCEVKLVEIDSDTLDLDAQPLVWPKLAEGHRIPFIDAALILYDITKRASLERIPELLDAFAKASLPNLLVASKCDVPLTRRQIDPAAALEHLGPFGGVESMQTSANSTGSQKKCMATILNIIIARRNEKNSRYSNGRRRANSSATHDSRGTSPRPSTARSGHSRASSEFSATLFKDYPSSALNGQPQGRLSRISNLHAGSSQGASHLSVPMERAMTSPASSAPQLTLTISPMPEIISEHPFTQKPERQHSGSVSTPGTQPKPGDSFLDIDDDASVKDPDDVPILEREGSILEDLDDDKKPARAVGFTWDELVDRLLQENMSRADSNFVTIFLCFYRKIAPPRDLLKSILERFEKANSEEIELVRINKQIRYCTVLNQWVADHPGDFAYPKTRQQLIGFLNTICVNRTFAFLAREIQQNLLNTVEDEDATWGRADGDMESEAEPSKATSLAPDGIKPGSGEGASGSKAADRPALYIPRQDADRRPSDAPSSLSIYSLGGGGGIIGGVYAQFMETPDEDIAAELTRLDWVEFSKIRVRDLVRHVSTSPAQKETCKSLQHVSRMISHFNHIAYWVVNIILERPKAKHRGRALEKFMTIAWILRHKNNYNALGAVIAGIGSTCIHRLAQTRECVNPKIQKQFMRLELLMGSHKSHFSYRLALENTSTERIPFLPLHRRDLVSTDEGNKTFLENNKINWNKFQLMGDTLMVIIESQRNPYKGLNRNPLIERMILDAVIITNDDELFEKSVTLEGRRGHQTSYRRGSRRWFDRGNRD